MPIGFNPVGELPVLDANDELAEPSPPVNTYWITIDRIVNQSDVVPSVQVGSLSCDMVLNGKSTMNCTLLNPTYVPQAGQVIKFVDRAKLIFAGKIQSVDLTAPQDEAVKSYQLDCVGWEGDMERRLVTSNYANASAGNFIRAGIVDASLDDEGFTQGVIDEGPTILLADADHVRASEYLRDIASAGGGALEVGSDKSISFRRLDLRPAPFPLINAEPEEVRVTEDKDNYCNKVTIKITGTGSTTTSIVRQDPIEIAARQAIEGGTGIYEVYEKIVHPTSNVVEDLARFGITYAFLLMAARGRVAKNVSAKLRRPLLDVGQIIDVNLPGMGALGTYQISRLGITDEEAMILYAIEATYTSRRQLNLDSIQRIVSQARATIVLPSDDFANTVTLTTNQTWAVPGTGTVQVEVQTNGGGGGGSGSSAGGTAFTGGTGGAGGKATSFREYAAGTNLTVVIGGGGSGGASATAGSAGGETYVASPTEARVARGYGGQPGTPGPSPFEFGVNGAPGTAAGDYPFTGQGSPGGAGGSVGSGGAGSNGSAGKVVIRY